MSQLLIYGVDPGKSGAVAVLDRITGDIIDLFDMPVVGPIISAVVLHGLCRDHIDPLSIARHHGVIEDVHAMPKQGVSSSFSFGRSLGVIEGVLAANGMALHYVSPAKWKRALGLTADKGASRRRAIELWPQHATKFARVKDDGRAEAALIAHWWLHHGEGRSA